MQLCYLPFSSRRSVDPGAVSGDGEKSIKNGRKKIRAKKSQEREEELFFEGGSGKIVALQMSPKMESLYGLGRQVKIL